MTPQDILEPDAVPPQQQLPIGPDDLERIRVLWDTSNGDDPQNLEWNLLREFGLSPTEAKRRLEEADG